MSTGSRWRVGHVLRQTHAHYRNLLWRRSIPLVPRRRSRHAKAPSLHPADLFRKHNTTAPQFTEGCEPRPHPLCSYRWTRVHSLTCDCFCLCLPAQGADRLVMPSAFSDRLTTWPALSRRGRGGRCAHCPMFAQDQPRCSATRLSAYVFCARITTSGLAVIPSSCSRITDGSFWGRCDLNNQPDRQPETSAPCAPAPGTWQNHSCPVRGIAARALPCPRPMVSAPAEAFCGGRRGAYTLRHGRGRPKRETGCFVALVGGRRLRRLLIRQSISGSPHAAARGRKHSSALLGTSGLGLARHGGSNNPQNIPSTAAFCRAPHYEYLRARVGFTVQEEELPDVCKGPRDVLTTTPAPAPRSCRQGGGCAGGPADPSGRGLPLDTAIVSHELPYSGLRT
jgi:hypothetical protein